MQWTEAPNSTLPRSVSILTRGSGLSLYGTAGHRRITAGGAGPRATTPSPLITSSVEGGPRNPGSGPVLSKSVLGGGPHQMSSEELLGPAVTFDLILDPGESVSLVFESEELDRDVPFP
jgi:hypothetical protein